MKEAKENTSRSASLALEFVSVTEVAAIEAAEWIGKGEGKAADKAAVDAMRKRFNEIAFNGTVVIGEGAKDESHELYIGERLGTRVGRMFDIAVDPLECTDSVANGRPEAIAVIATGPKGSLYHAADSYMEKIACGREAAEVIDLDFSVKVNVKNVAKMLHKNVFDVTVAILDRERHASLIQQVRDTGARVRLFSDGDVAMAVATCKRESPIDLLMGTGGSTEAVLAAAALKCLGGQILCRWKPKPEHVKRLKAAGIKDFDKVFTRDDLARGDDITFTATGVVSGSLLEGVLLTPDQIITHSVIMSSSPKTIRFLKGYHQR